MDELDINWEQERPSRSAQAGLWAHTTFEREHTWTSAAEALMNKIRETHLNGGVQLHRYRVTSNEHFTWFASRNRLDEIDFVYRTISHKDLRDYRSDLMIHSDPQIKIEQSHTDIYGLPGELAKVLGYGGAYKSVHQKEAWTIVTDFIKSEFDNRFQEVLMFDFITRNAGWFCGVAWDHSTMLFDKRYDTVTIIDITDTD